MSPWIVQNRRKYHFIKVLPASPSILDSQGFVFQRKFDGVSAEVFIEEDIRIIGSGITEGKPSDYTEKFPELVKELKRLNLPEGTEFLPEIIVVNQQTGIEECSLVQTRTGREANIELFSQVYPALMIIHDAAAVGGKDVSQHPYFERLNPLKPVLDNT
jgi:ATP-dependent DNA ligase